MIHTQYIPVALDESELNAQVKRIIETNESFEDG